MTTAFKSNQQKNNKKTVFRNDQITRTIHISQILYSHSVPQGPIIRGGTLNPIFQTKEITT